MLSLMELLAGLTLTLYHLNWELVGLFPDHAALALRGLSSWTWKEEGGGRSAKRGKFDGGGGVVEEGG